MQEFMKDPASVTIERKAITAPDIKQYVVQIRDSVRTEAIARLMDVNNFKLGMVFCNTQAGHREQLIAGPADARVCLRCAQRRPEPTSARLK